MKKQKAPKETISIHELFAEQRKQEKKRLRKEYCVEHRFDIINAVMSFLAIIISIIALIVSIIAL